MITLDDVTTTATPGHRARAAGRLDGSRPVSVWDSPVRRAMEDAQMELNIAAAAWRVLPNQRSVELLERRVDEYEAARDAWVRLVAGPSAPPAARPACPSCGHTHATEGMAAICVGCPCQEGGQA